MRDQVSHIAIGDAFGLGNFMNRLDLTTRELLEPLPPTDNCFDEGRVGPGIARALLPAVKDESHLDAATPNTGRDCVANNGAWFIENSR